MFPWENHTLKTENHPYRSYRDCKTKTLMCRREKQYLDDSPQMKYRKGNIIKFGRGTINKCPPGWQEWFLKTKDKKKFLVHDKITPYYARNQYGIIVGRFRTIKYKYRIFYDYGCVVMMLTGKNPGRIRSFHMKKPFKQKVLFPNKITYKYLIKALPENIINIFNDIYENTNDGRNLLLSRLYHEVNLKGSE